MIQSNDDLYVSHYDNISIAAQMLGIVTHLANKGMDVYLTAKELEVQGQKIELLRTEVLEFYKTERARMLAIFYDRDEDRRYIQELIRTSISVGDSECRNMAFDLYKEFIKLPPEAYQTKKFRDTYNLDNDNIIKY
jgi:hypothetical protein